MAWQPLPDGKDIAITAPNFYAIVAQVGAQHSEVDIRAQASKRGLNIFQYSESPSGADGYRLVSAQAQATSSGSSLPWSPGFPADLAAHYHLVSAWWSPPVDQPSSPQASTAPANDGVVVGVAIGVAAAALAAYLWLRRR
jgi:hypothetical protein